jgi:hypothetical protein
MALQIASQSIKALDRLLDPVRDILTPEVAQRLADLRADAEAQARLDELAQKNASATISAEERAEYDAMVIAGNVIAVLQAKARSVLQDGHSS